MAAPTDLELSDSQLRTSEMTQTVSHGGCLNMQPGRNEEPNEAATGLLSPTDWLRQRRGRPSGSGTGLPKAIYPEDRSS